MMKEELYREWSRVLETMKLLNGDNLAAFEKEIAAYLEARHAFGILGFLVAMAASLLGGIIYVFGNYPIQLRRRKGNAISAS